MAIPFKRWPKEIRFDSSAKSWDFIAEELEEQYSCDEMHYFKLAMNIVNSPPHGHLWYRHYVVVLQRCSSYWESALGVCLYEMSVLWRHLLRESLLLNEHDLHSRMNNLRGWKSTWKKQAWPGTHTFAMTKRNTLFLVKPEYFQVLFQPLRLFTLLQRSCSLSYLHLQFKIGFISERKSVNTLFTIASFANKVK